jgi:hypothetical protein
MSYLIGHGMQPSALDRLIKKMEENTGGQPLFSAAPRGYRGNPQAMQRREPKPPMFKGISNARI